MDGEEQFFNFDPRTEIVCRFSYVKVVPHQELGAQRAYGTLVVKDENGREHDVKFSCAPWMGYLIPSLVEMAKQPEQEWSGIHLETKGDFINLVGIHENAEPANWQDKLNDWGLGSRPKANGRPAMRPPVKTGAKAETVGGGFEDEA